MSTVRMRHPDLPPEQEIEVSERAVPHHQAAGWLVVDQPQEADPYEAAEPVASPSQSETPSKRRRAATEEND